MDQALALKERYYQGLLVTGIRNNSNWQEPIRVHITEGIGMFIGLVSGAVVGYVLGISSFFQSGSGGSGGDLFPCVIAGMGGMAGMGVVVFGSDYWARVSSAQSLQRELLKLVAQEPALLQRKNSANARMNELNELYGSLKKQEPAYRASFEGGQLVQGQYSKMHVRVENAGTGPADSLTVLLEGQLEGELKADFGDLPVGESAEAQLSIKPTAAGQMKWQAKLVCKDILGRERTLYQNFWVKVVSPPTTPPSVVSVGGDFMPGGQKLTQGDNSAGYTSKR